MWQKNIAVAQIGLKVNLTKFYLENYDQTEKVKDILVLTDFYNNYQNVLKDDGTLDKEILNDRLSEFETSNSENVD